MRGSLPSVIAVAALLLVDGASTLQAQTTPPAAPAGDAARAVAGGGISVKGWMGAVDASEAKAGQTVANAKLVAEGNGAARHDRSRHRPTGTRRTRRRATTR